jgi:hypothetical protein
MASAPSVSEPAAPEQSSLDRLDVERAAGTGLTGSSDQEFVSVSVGELETEATVIRLRLVIGTDESLAAARPLPQSDAAPVRPVARP